MELNLELALNHEFRIREFRNRSSEYNQRSSGWINERNDFITGSIIASAIGIMGPCARQNILIEKASNGKIRSFFGNQASHFGSMMEPISNMIYCLKYGTRINSFNQVRHETVPYLACSTDGVTDQCINIEIKSLFSREIKSKHIKREYYHQMQLQMHCLNLEITHFIEVKYKVSDKIPNITDESNIREGLLGTVGSPDSPYQGIIIETWNINENCIEYLYSEISINLDILRNWYEITMKYLQDSDTHLYTRSIFWSLDQFNLQVVKRDKKWLELYGPELNKFWNEVLYLRANPDKLNELIQKKNNLKKKNKYTDDSMNQLDTCLL